jgi:hypothetical protein
VALTSTAHVRQRRPRPQVQHPQFHIPKLEALLPQRPVELARQFGSTSTASTGTSQFRTARVTAALMVDLQVSELAAVTPTLITETEVHIRGSILGADKLPSESVSRPQYNEELQGYGWLCRGTDEAGTAATPRPLVATLDALPPPAVVSYSTWTPPRLPPRAARAAA